MSQAQPIVRPAAVAGLFYPRSAAALKGTLHDLLATCQPAPDIRPKAMIVPHAGYSYSGPVAATLYAPLTEWREIIERIVLLGPSHRFAFNGLAAPSATAFATPLGDVPIDLAALAAIRHLPQVVVSDPAHAAEHSLEVQLPFLQTVLDRFTLIPLAVGRASPAQVAEVLECLWGGDETLIVISSDLSHYLPYAVAREVDADTARSILACEAHLHHQQACGATPVNGLLLTARQHNLRARMIDLRNSGDTAGDRSRVVGYGAFAFTRASDDS